MSGENSRFTSDRRLPSRSSWASEADWKAGTGENVNVVGGSVVPQTTLVTGEIPDSGVARWIFEQSGGDEWNGYELTLSGATYSTTSYEGSYSLNVDWGGDYATAGRPISELNGTSEFSVVLWANVDNFSGGTANPSFFAQGDSWDNHIYINHSEGDSTIAFGVSNGGIGNVVRFADSDLGTGSWGMLTLTYDGTNIYGYLNDVQKDSASAPSITPTVSNPAEMGRNTWIGDSLSSQIDDVRVYSKCLTPTEVSNLYNTGRLGG